MFKKHSAAVQEKVFSGTFGTAALAVEEIESAEALVNMDFPLDIPLLNYQKPRIPTGSGILMAKANSSAMPRGRRTLMAAKRTGLRLSLLLMSII